ncbi:MAG TPA: polysaccharide deacetylase family protein [Patescibacteria group bacterium]|nr:polysaccharide deacetylase family protein [Patescibacteria group bacterium]
MKSKKVSNSNPLVSVLIITCILGFILLFTVFLIKNSRDFSNAQAATIANSSIITGENQPQPDINEPNDHVILHGSRDKKQIALTFDADMTAYMRQQVELHNYPTSINYSIIQILEQTHTKATIFLTGMWAEMYPVETKTLADNSLFEIGSHSYSHQSFSGYCYGLGELPKNEVEKEIGYTEGLLEQIAGVKVQFFRFPGGCYDASSVQMVNAAGEQVVHWDVVGDDGFNNDTQSIIQNVITHVQNGSIIVLHFNGPPTAPMTADALPTIIQQLKAKGYEFVKVNELLGMPEEVRTNN